MDINKETKKVSLRGVKKGDNSPNIKNRVMPSDELQNSFGK